MDGSAHSFIMTAGNTCVSHMINNRKKTVLPQYKSKLAHLKERKPSQIILIYLLSVQ